MRSVRRWHGAERRPDGVPAVCTDRRRDGRSVRDVRCGERAKYAADWMRCVRYRVCGHWRRVCAVCAWEAGECVEDDMRHVCFDLSGLCGSDGTCAACGDGTAPNVDFTACQPCAPTGAGTAGVCDDVCCGERAESLTRLDAMRAVQGLRARAASARSVRLGASRMQTRDCVRSLCVGLRGVGRDVRCVWRRDGAERGPDGVPAVRADRCWHGRCLRHVCCGERADRRPDRMCACGRGFAGTGGECAQCAPGSEPNASSACVECAEGMGGVGRDVRGVPGCIRRRTPARLRASRALPTDAGTAGVCTTCTAGSEPVPDQTSCAECATGFAGTGGECVQCEPGQDAGSGPHKLRDVRRWKGGQRRHVQPVFRWRGGEQRVAADVVCGVPVGYGWHWRCVRRV